MIATYLTCFFQLPQKCSGRIQIFNYGAGIPDPFRVPDPRIQIRIRKKYMYGSGTPALYLVGRVSR